MTTPAAKALLSHLRTLTPRGADLTALQDTGIARLEATLKTCLKAGLIENIDGIYHLTDDGLNEIFTAPPPPVAPSLRFVASEIVMRDVAALLPDARNARTHSPEQIEQLATIIRTYGWTVPVLIGPDDKIIAGHGRLQAAPLVPVTRVPCVVLPHLSDDERRALMLADNRLAELAGWDDAMLKAELLALSSQGVHITDLGWDADDLACLKAMAEAKPQEPPGTESPKTYDLVVTCASPEEQAKAAKVLKKANLTYHKFQAD